MPTIRPISVRGARSEWTTNVASSLPRPNSAASASMGAVSPAPSSRLRTQKAAKAAVVSSMSWTRPRRAGGVCTTVLKAGRVSCYECTARISSLPPFGCGLVPLDDAFQLIENGLSGNGAAGAGPKLAVDRNDTLLLDHVEPRESGRLLRRLQRLAAVFVEGGQEQPVAVDLRQIFQTQRVAVRASRFDQVAILHAKAGSA